MKIKIYIFMFYLNIINQKFNKIIKLNKNQ